MKLTFNKEEVKKALELLKPDGEPFEIRTISKKGKDGTIYSGYFTDTEKVVEVLSKHEYTGIFHIEQYRQRNYQKRQVQ